MTAERAPVPSLLKVTALRGMWWGLGWTVTGLLVGIVFTLAHVEFMAESGAKPPGYSDSAPWIFIFGVGGACFGLLLGVITELELGLVRVWRPVPSGLMARGAAAAIAGGIVGGFTGTLSLVWTGLALGAATPGVAEVLTKAGRTARR